MLGARWLNLTWPECRGLWALALLFCGALSAPARAATYAHGPTAFNWIDPSTHTNVVWTGAPGGPPPACSGGYYPIDDDISTPINIGFTFSFGGVGYTQVRIMSNGRLQFNNTFCGFGTQSLGPPPTYPYPYPNGKLMRTMRVYGVDLDPTPNGSSGTTKCNPAKCYVRYATLGSAPNRAFVVTWHNVPEWSQKKSSFDLQVILYENGNFVFQYGKIENPSGGQAQIGWELTTTDYDTVGYGGDITTMQNQAILFYPATTVHHFAINVGAASGSTCAPKNVTLTAQDAANNTVTHYTGTVNITTSSGHGDWSVVAASGTLNNGAADDGQAAYTFATTDNGAITLALSNAHADDLTVSVVDGTIPSTLSTSSIIHFRDNAFVITNDPIQVAGRDQAMTVALWRRDPSTGNCAIATAYTGAKALDAWITRDPLDPGGAAPRIGALSLPSSMPPSNPASNNLTLNFASGQASFALSTSDVGKYVLNLRDDTRSFATGVDITGASNSITTRPFGLGFTNIKKGALSNPGGTATGGAKFVAAGDAFEATVAGYLWQAADDTNNDGVPDSGANVTDNGVTPSYAWPTVLSSASPFTPSAGTLGILGGTTSIPQGGFSGGAATVVDLTYSEVGSMTLKADSINYLGSAGVNPTGTSAPVGRFYPASFALVSGSVTGACGSFTYMDQPALGVSFNLEARNRAGAKTSNYSTGIYATGTVTALAENNDNGIDLSGRLALPASTWVSGTYSVNTLAARFSRSGSPDGPYDNLQLGVRVNDPDGAQVAPLDMDPATAGPCSPCTGKTLPGTTQARFGRLKLFNAHGSELLPLPVRMEAQYWNGFGFVTNPLDNCTAIAPGNVALWNYQLNLNPGETTVTTGGPFSAGVGSLTLSAPGAGNNGAVDLGVNLGAGATGNACLPGMPPSAPANLDWLRGKWCGTAYDRDPTARTTFGIYSTPKQFIYQRENY